MDKVIDDWPALKNLAKTISELSDSIKDVTNVLKLGSSAHPVTLTLEHLTTPFTIQVTLSRLLLPRFHRLHSHRNLITDSYHSSHRLSRKSRRESCTCAVKKAALTPSSLTAISAVHRLSCPRQTAIHRNTCRRCSSWSTLKSQASLYSSVIV